MIRIPRAAGLDRGRVARHIAALERFPGTLAQYARKANVRLELLVAAIQRDAPLWWEIYLKAHPAIPQRACENCARTFFVARAGQRLCSRLCGAQLRGDVKYFDGDRRKALGWYEGECQCCGRVERAGLSSHHVTGRDNDPRNERLAALCRGCHQLVGILANRKAAGESWFWENLIELVVLRRGAGRVFRARVDVEIERHLELAEARS